MIRCGNSQMSLEEFLLMAFTMIAGEPDVDYWLYEKDLERIPLENWIHRN